MNGVITKALHFTSYDGPSYNTLNYVPVSVVQRFLEFAKQWDVKPLGMKVIHASGARYNRTAIMEYEADPAAAQRLGAEYSDYKTATESIR